MTFEEQDTFPALDVSIERFRQDKIVFIRNMHMNAVVPLSLSDIQKGDSQREYGTTQTLTALDI